MEESRINKYNRRKLSFFKKKNNVIFLVLFILLFVVAVGIYNFLLLPNIRLKGSRFVEIDYLEEYKESGYSAYFLHDDVTDEVKVTNNINSKKIGKYEVKYEVNISGFKREVVRVVSVIDKSAPIITLASTDDISVCPGKSYVEESFSAIDSYEGDLTSKVKVVHDTDKISYSVKDKAGNSTSISRNIIYEDKTPPVITLIGNDVSYVFVGEKYTEVGVNVTDNCDSDLSNSIEVLGTVNVNVPGTYELTYTVRDKAGNSSSVKRKVIVAHRNKNGTIYLTFDDGPKRGTTDVILDILKEEGVEATFFVTNTGPDDLIKRAYDEGHSIALHTATHNYSIVYASVDSYFRDLEIISERVKRITGEESKIIRFPGGSSNTISRRYSPGIMSVLTKEVLNRGYRYYDWNISSGDAAGGSPSPEKIYNNVISSLSKNKVNMVLMHDIKPYTRDALRSIIRYGKDNGYTFEKITMETEMITQRVNN